MGSPDWQGAFDRARHDGPYREYKFPVALVAHWFPPAHRTMPELGQAASRIAEAAEKLASAHRGESLIQPPAPSDIASALASISQHAKGLASGFHTLVRAAGRRDQGHSDYGKTAQEMVEHLGTVLLASMLDTNPERALEAYPIISEKVPWSVVGPDGTARTNVAMMTALRRLAEHAEMLRALEIPAADKSSNDEEHVFVRELASVWTELTGKKARADRRKVSLSPFHRFVAAVYGHIAGARVATLDFELEQANIGAASFPDDDPAKEWGRAAAKARGGLIREHSVPLFPSGGSIQNWLRQK